jgi:hypothetical protein
MRHLDDWKKLLKTRVPLFKTQLPEFSWPAASGNYTTRLASALGELFKSVASSNLAKAKQNIFSMIYLTMLLYASQFSLEDSERAATESQKVAELQTRFILENSVAPAKALFLGVLWTPLVCLLPTDLRTMAVTNKFILKVSQSFPSFDRADTVQNAQAIGAEGPVILKRIEAKILRFVLESAVGDGQPLETLASLTEELSKMLENLDSDVDVEWYKAKKEMPEVVEPVGTQKDDSVRADDPVRTDDPERAVDTPLFGLEDTIEEGRDRIAKRKLEMDLELERAKRPREEDQSMDVEEDPVKKAQAQLEACRVVAEKALTALGSVLKASQSSENREYELRHAVSLVEMAEAAALEVSEMVSEMEREKTDAIASLLSEAELMAKQSRFNADEAKRLKDEMEAQEALVSAKEAREQCQSALESVEEAYMRVTDPEDAREASRDAKQAVSEARLAAEMASTAVERVNKEFADLHEQVLLISDEVTMLKDQVEAKAAEVEELALEVTSQDDRIKQATQDVLQSLGEAKAARDKADKAFQASKNAVSKAQKALGSVQQAARAKDAKKGQKGCQDANDAFQQAEQEHGRIRMIAEATRDEAEKVEEVIQELSEEAKDTLEQNREEMWEIATHVVGIDKSPCSSAY